MILPGGKVHTIEIRSKISGSRDVRGIISSTSQQIRFTNEEDQNGQQFLNEIGIKVNEHFVCLFVRDSGYKEKFQNWKSDWSYHNHRNTDMDTYKQAATKLAEKGYWIFRMGKSVEKQFNVDHPRILDYANQSYRSDFLDIWLMGNCHFCISVGRGLDAVSDVFRRKVVYVNFIPMPRHISWSANISVPKKLVWQISNTPLSFEETFEHTYSNFYNYSKAGIEIIDLTPNEISEGVLEMEARISGKWKDTIEDSRLQNLYWGKLKKWSEYNKLHGLIHPEARIGADFLRKNHSWFLN